MDAIDNTKDAAEIVAIDTDPDAPMKPPHQTEAGVAMIATANGEYPANHRLRAEAMARAGVTHDEDGLIGDDLIASTKDRLEREDAEADRVAAREAAAHPTVKATMLKADLITIAEAENVFVGDGDTNATIVANIEAARAANKEA